MASATRTQTSTSRQMPQPGTPDADGAEEGNWARHTEKSSGQSSLPKEVPPLTGSKRKGTQRPERGSQAGWCWLAAGGEDSPLTPLMVRL